MTQRQGTQQCSRFPESLCGRFKADEQVTISTIMPRLFFVQILGSFKEIILIGG